MSSVVRPGAVRIGTASRSISDKNIIYSAFLNPDGSKALVILNSGDADVTATIGDASENFKAVVPAQGVVSCSWK